MGENDFKEGAEIHFPVVEFEDFLQFTAERGVNTPCEACGSQSWYMQSYIDGKTPVFVAKKFPGDSTEEMSLPVILNFCSNCGNIRTFSRHVFDEWQLKRRRIENDG